MRLLPQVFLSGISGILEFVQLNQLKLVNDLLVFINLESVEFINEIYSFQKCYGQAL